MKVPLIGINNIYASLLFIGCNICKEFDHSFTGGQMQMPHSCHVI